MWNTLAPIHMYTYIYMPLSIVYVNMCVLYIYKITVMPFLCPVLRGSADAVVLILNSYCTLVGNHINEMLFLRWYFVALIIHYLHF